jgi:outer membrane protein TolC
MFRQMRQNFSSGMKTISISVLLFGVVASGAAVESAAVTNGVRVTPEYLSGLAEEMRTNSPALQAAYARTNAAQAEIDAVRTWEDPMLRLGGMAAREEMRADEGDLIYGVEQKLPLFGKPRLARDVARSGLATEVAGAEYQFQTLRRELAKAVFQAALADQIVAIGEQDLAWLNTVGEALPGRYRAGQATLVDVLQLDNERARRATQLKTDRDQLGHQRVSLNRLLNRDLAAPWPALELPTLAGPVVFNQQLVDLAVKYEPKVQMMRRQIQQAEATAASTRRSRLPDVNVGVEARNYSGDGSFRQGMLVLSLNLPLANAGKYRHDLQRDEAKVKATEFDLADYEWAVREEVHLLTVKIESARREALLYRDEIIPRTTTALDSARTGWEGNQNSFRDVLDARRMLLEARLMYARAVADQYQMLSELVLCCGIGDLGALQMIGAQPAAPPGDKSNEK